MNLEIFLSEITPSFTCTGLQRSKAAKFASHTAERERIVPAIQRASGTGPAEWYIEFDQHQARRIANYCISAVFSISPPAKNVSAAMHPDLVSEISLNTPDSAC